MTEARGAPILSKLAQGMTWGGVSVAVMTVLQLALLAVMARLLEPAQFGIVAVAGVCLRFVTHVSQLGIGPGIVQKPHLDDADIAAARAMSVGLGAAGCAVVIGIAPLLAWAVDMPAVVPVLQVLSLGLLIGGFSAVSVSVLRRAMRFRALATIDVVAYGLGYGVVGLSAAFAGWGVWSLVLALLSQSTLTAVLSHRATKRRLTFSHESSRRKHFVQFGGPLAFTSFIEFLSLNLDTMVVARTAGAPAAGLYNRALLLSNLPVEQPVNVFSRVLFPVLSRLEERAEARRVGFEVSLLAVGCYAFAVSAGVHAAAADIVGLLLGPAWQGSVAIIEILTWAVGPLFVVQICGVTLDAMGAVKPKARLQFAMLVLFVALLAGAGLGGDPAAVAWIVATVAWVRMILMLWLLRPKLGVRFEDLSRILGMIAATACMTGALVMGAVQAAQAVPEVGLRVLIEVAAGVAAMALSFLVVRSSARALRSVQVIAARMTYLRTALGGPVAADVRRSGE